jgi:hypothetical protein
LAGNGKGNNNENGRLAGSHAGRLGLAQHSVRDGRSLLGYAPATVIFPLTSTFLLFPGNRTIRPKKYDSAWPNKKQRIVAAFLSFLFGQGRIV